MIGIDETRFWWREPWLTGIIDLANSDLIRLATTVSAWENEFLAFFDSGGRTAELRAAIE